MNGRKVLDIILCAGVVLSVCWSALTVIYYCHGVETLRGVTFRVVTVSIDSSRDEPVLVTLELSSSTGRPYRVTTMSGTLLRDGQTVAILSEFPLNMEVFGQSPVTAEVALQPGLDFQAQDSLSRVEESAAVPWDFVGEVLVHVPHKRNPVRLSFSLESAGS